MAATNQLTILPTTIHTFLDQPLHNPVHTFLGPPIRQFDLVVCVVCGGICKITHHNTRVQRPTPPPDWMRPSLIQGKAGYLEWMKGGGSARPSPRPDDALVEVLEVEYIGSGQGMRRGDQQLPINTEDELMRIPIHMACLTVARHFCTDQLGYRPDFRCPSGGAPSSITHLYEIWCKRAIATNPGGPVSRPILEPNQYLGAPVPRLEADYSTIMRDDPTLDRFLACPLDIPGLTDLVVSSRLRAMHLAETVPDRDFGKLRRRIMNMPQEIADGIADGLCPFEGGRKGTGPPLEPTRVLPPRWWMQALLSGQLFPWLWDLDRDAVVAYHARNFYRDAAAADADADSGAYVFDEDAWDWELLCRQLAQPGVLEEGGFLHGCSAQLWNRRRIWELLNSARLGHVRFPPEGR
ncbi:hypothetical protein F4802DRAFT_592878 [Xylaria palmicola]|nr:hypothetical protein F4802DRAFT_592878 [Xylaria palmicola]